MLLNCGVGEDSWESLGLQGNQTSQSWRKSVLNFHWKDMLKLKLQGFGHLMWRADSLEKILMLGKIEGKRRRGLQRMRWLDGITDLMNCSLSMLRGLLMTGKPGVLKSTGSQRVGHNWVTELKWKPPSLKTQTSPDLHCLPISNFHFPWWQFQAANVAYWRWHSEVLHMSISGEKSTTVPWRSGSSGHVLEKGYDSRWFLEKEGIMHGGWKEESFSYTQVGR